VQVCGNAGWLASAPISIQDAPSSQYRGFMIDTGRHYIKPARLYAILSAMAMLKLNVLHWHISDSTSFPVVSERFPALARAAFARSAIYTLADLRGVVAYAKARGIRIVPEFDLPGHGSWWVGMPQLNLSSCSDVLDPTNPEVYAFLATFLQEMAGVFPDPWLMLGGDEVGFDPR